MNVVVLTPDAVGSTLLQRMLTIYMQFHSFDRPVINLHELTNGLAKYYSPEFGREIVSKRQVSNWGYFQSLQQVVDLLSSVDHYKTSRLAHYHLVRRNDSVEQQIPFYNYLNDNFFIIACRRANVFEHALSMTLTSITKKLNVYDVAEKINTFLDIYKSGVILDETVFQRKLVEYANYIKWSEQYFNIGRYFNYEQHVPQLEQFILDLPVFAKHAQKITWDDNFGLSWNTWNQMHYAISDVNLLTSVNQEQIDNLFLQHNQAVQSYQQHAPQDWPPVHSIADAENLPIEIKQSLNRDYINSHGLTSLGNSHQQKVLTQYRAQYLQVQDMIKKMIDLDIIISGPPIKKQQLFEKKKIIKNFQRLIEIYNDWIVLNPDLGSAITDNDINACVEKESAFWNSIFIQDNTQPVALPNQQ